MLELEPQHGQNDNNNSNGISQQSMSNRQAAQLALEALHLQLQEKNAQPAFAPPPLRGPTTIELGRQNSESSLGRLLSAQALLSQVPASAGINSRQPGAKTSINSISGSIQAQNGTFYPPRGGAPSSSSSAAVALSEARSAVPARLLDRAQPQPAQSVQSGQVVNKASPTPVDTAAKGTSAVSSSVSPPSPPSQEQQQLVLERQASSGGPDLSNRLNEVSNLLKGFGTPFIPAVRNSSVGSSVGNTNVNANDNSRGQRSTTPTSHLVNRRIAASAEGTTTPAAGQNKPNFYRAPVPVQSVAKEDDVPPKSASALLSLPVPAPSPAQTPMRPLPAAIVPSRYQQQSSVLSIDTSAMLSTPSGRPSSVPFAESSGTVSTTRTGPVSAATFLNSLPKPAAPGPPSSANRISVSTGAGLSSFSPRLLDQQGGLNGSSAATPLQGKFSQPQVYSK